MNSFQVCSGANWYHTHWCVSLSSLLVALDPVGSANWPWWRYSHHQQLIQSSAYCMTSWAEHTPLSAVHLIESSGEHEDDLDMLIIGEKCIVSTQSLYNSSLLFQDHLHGPFRPFDHALVS